MRVGAVGLHMAVIAELSLLKLSAIFSAVSGATTTDGAGGAASDLRHAYRSPIQPSAYSASGV
jgi:hypothetical protein